MFTQSTKYFVEKYIPSWYGIGGEWIKNDFPMYVDINRKPESNYDIHYDYDRNFGIVMWLRLVKTAVNEEANSNQEYEYVLIHGTNPLD